MKRKSGHKSTRATRSTTRDVLKFAGVEMRKFSKRNREFFKRTTKLVKNAPKLWHKALDHIISSLKIG